MGKKIKRYFAVEKKFFTRIKKAFGSEIVLYCVTGSLGRNDIIPGWSDIDILLVVENYSAALFKSTLNALDTNTSGIKIGLTFYSVAEFNNELFKDPKTYHSLKLINDGIFSPRIFRKDKIKLAVPKKSTIKIFDDIDFTKVLQELKKELIKGQRFNEIKVYKNITLLLKILMRRNGVYCLGYKNVFSEAPHVLKGFLLRFSSPEEILQSPHLKQQRFQIYIDFLNWLKK